MTLFQRGLFQLHSGEQSQWKIDCDALTDEDIETLALLLLDRLPLFGSVYGVPTGGLRLALALYRYRNDGPILLVDDVLTTGGSMEQFRQRMSHGEVIGAVLFSRAVTCPSWITPLFTLSPARRLVVEESGDAH